MGKGGGRAKCRLERGVRGWGIGIGAGIGTFPNMYYIRE